MKQFKDKITLARNSRGCFILDTIKGCSGCTKERPLGCYGNCYAQAIASRYRLDFNNPIRRDFERDNQPSLFGFDDTKHESKIVKAISNIDMPFVRMGEMGDPSEDWEHTIKVCKIIALAGKPIVIITKHWKQIPKELYATISKLDLYINTSISAMDTEGEIVHRLIEYEKLKDYCKSILRVVSCDFNASNIEGARMSCIQERLFAKDNIINTVFRPNANNPLVLGGVIKTKMIRFLGASMLASMFDKDSFLGYCKECPDMCGTLTFPNHML
jgi:hypothetical protein